MPRVSILRFTKDYQTVADALVGMVKNAVMTEREEDGHPVIDIEGDFSHFVLEDMDLWETHLKFTIKDNKVEDADDREARAILAQGNPGFGDVLFSPTIAWVYQRIGYTLVTSTIVERVEDSKRTVISSNAQETDRQYEWKDITKEFSRKVRIER